MLHCEEFRRRVGAEPQRLDWTQRLHWLVCRACGRFRREMRALDRLITPALLIDDPPAHKLHREDLGEECNNSQAPPV